MIINNFLFFSISLYKKKSLHAAYSVARKLSNSPTPKKSSGIICQAIQFYITTSLIWNYNNYLDVTEIILTGKKNIETHSKKKK